MLFALSTMTFQKHKDEEARRDQYAAAMEWCKTEGRGAYAAASRTVIDDKGRVVNVWPLISESGLGRRLKDPSLNDNPWSSRSALTPEEVVSIVETCIELNNHAQGVTREKLGELVVHSLSQPALGAQCGPQLHTAFGKREKDPQGWWTTARVVQQILC